MTFLKWYGLGAVGFTMVITAIGLQWYVLAESFFDQIYNNPNNWHSVPVTIYALLDALYGVSAVLISFGAVIGKISPSQLIIMTIIELALQAFNFKVLMLGIAQITDLGGTYSDHMFGAYFGLSVAYVLGKPTSSPEFGNTPDIFSLIGTLFLWIYWPSFVAGAAEADSDQQQRAIVNTILALSASTIAAFWGSSYFSKTARYRPVDIQNATLAGGVAIGCVSNLTHSPFGALMVGLSAGLVSTTGYNVIQPTLEEKIKLHDTCGIHNLHAMPSVIGGISSIIIAAYSGSDGRSSNSSIYTNVHEQWWRQLVGMILCITFAIVSGIITGKLLKVIRRVDVKDSDFSDDYYWEVADDFKRTLYTELTSLTVSDHYSDDKDHLLTVSPIHHNEKRNDNVATNNNSTGEVDIIV